MIRLFDLTSGKEEKQFALGREGSYHSLAFSPDGKFLACGFSDDSFMLDLNAGKVLYKLTERPIGLVFSSDGQALIASTGHRLRLWDSATGQERNERPGEFGYNPALAVSPDGHLLASGDWMEQVVSLWETSTGRLMRRLPLKGEHRYVRNLAFSSDGQTLVACQGMGFLQFWDVATGKEQRTVQLNDPANPNKDHIYFYELRVSRDGKNVSALDRILGPTESTRLALWDTTTGNPANQQVFPGELRRTAWLDDGKVAALALNDGLTLVEVTTKLTRFRIPGLDVGGPVASSSNGRLIAQVQSGAVTVWESATGKQVATIPSQNREGRSRVEHLALAPDNRCIVTTDKDFLHVWDLATGKERYRWSLPEAGTDSWGKTFVFGLALSPDGKRAFTPLADGTALVWDLSPAYPSERLVKRASEKDIAGWWADLNSEDAQRAYGAVWRLAESPHDATIKFLRARLKPAADANYNEVRHLIGDLDSDTFAVREKAFKRLDELGNAAVPAMREVLEKQPSLEVRRRLETLLSRPSGLVRSSETLRNLRATQVLELIASNEARQLLTEIAKGVPHAIETKEAKASLERLNQRVGITD